MQKDKHTPAGRALIAGLLATTILAAPLAVAAGAFQAPAPVTIEQAQAPADFSAVIEAVRPAVVSIYAERAMKPSAIQAMPGSPRFGEGHPFHDFFERFGPAVPDHGFGGRDAPSHMTKALGSGFFVSDDGYIVTNQHVVDSARRITVRLDDGKELEAKLIGADAKTDLALLKVSGAGFAHVAFADGGGVKPGQWVVTVGAPFGLGGSATAGIVSARGRDIGAGPYDDFIQIDAPINRGNSGGPAFDLGGRVVGVNTAIFSPSGANAGVGFAISAEVAADVVADLKDDGKVVRGWLGVTVQPLSEDLAKALDLGSDKGALIAAVHAKAPAHEAEIEAGDVVVAVDDKPIATVRDLTGAIAAASPEAVVRLALMRDGKRLEKSVRLGTMPGEAEPTARADTEDEKGKLGIALADVDGKAVVTAVKPGSEAADKGIRPGTAILAVGTEKTRNVADVVAAVDKARAAGDEVLLLQLETRGGKRFLALGLGGNA
jgi:serine protease Do